LGTGQLSLAKYLFIATDEAGIPGCHDIGKFLIHFFERIDLNRDLHFHTRTSIDTLDYSGEGLNEGSKLVLAAGAIKLRDLQTALPALFNNLPGVTDPRLLLPGVVAIKTNPFYNYNDTRQELDTLIYALRSHMGQLSGIVQLVLYDDFDLVHSRQVLQDYLWLTYTRSNPSHDVYGVEEFIENKHWGCRGPLIIDARKKPHHAPELKKDPEVEKRIERFFVKGAPLEKWS
jgi:4-hydroxy-3-polyprenylbenzoate decarboxylase